MTEARWILPFINVICISRPSWICAALIDSGQAGRDAEPVQQVRVAIALRVLRGQERVADEDRIRAGKKAQRLQFIGHILPSSGQPHDALRHHDPSGRHQADQRKGFGTLRGVVDRHALDLVPHVDWNALRMAGEIGEQHEHAKTVLDALAHADNAAAAHLDAGLSNMCECVDAILQSTGADDLAVELRRGVDVVIVEVDSSLKELYGLVRSQHAERDAGFHSKTFDRANHIADLIEIAVFWTAPGRGHAEAARAGIFGALCAGDHIGAIHQAGRFQTGLVMRALGAVAAIFRTAARLDAEQACGLDVVWIEVVAVNALRPKHQVGKRQAVERLGLGALPVTAELCADSNVVPFYSPRGNH